MKSFSTDSGRVYDYTFLQRIIRSMATPSPNGDTIGAAITKLSLSIYGGCYYSDGNSENERRVAHSSYPAVSTLIATCPNTVSLLLRGVKSDGPLKQRRVTIAEYLLPWFPSILNERGACKRVMENLVELSICGQWMEVLGSDRPIINFKRLTTLKLDGCSVQVNLWPEFLRMAPTLENLHMIDVISIEGKDDADEREYAEVNTMGLDWIVPFPLPNLKSLEVNYIRDWLLLECNKAFVNNLVGCPNLHEVSLMLDEKSDDEASLVRLASMDISLKMKARLMLVGNEKVFLSAFDSSSRFKVVNIFHERMDSFELMVVKEWSPRLTIALEDVISTCSNLTTFCLLLSDIKWNIISKEETKKVTTALVRLFTDQERAIQLHSLSLNGEFGEAVFIAVFDNCLNLRQLEIFGCPDLRDQHLIDWVARGGGILIDLSIFDCSNVTSEGIISILAKSAEGLLRVKVQCLDAPGARRWETLLGTVCPNAKIG